MGTMVSYTYQINGLLDNIIEKNNRITLAKDLVIGMVDVQALRADLGDVLLMALEGGDPFPEPVLQLDTQHESGHPATTRVIQGGDPPPTKTSRRAQLP